MLLDLQGWKIRCVDGFQVRNPPQKTECPKSWRGGNQTSLPLQEVCVSHTVFSTADTGGVPQDTQHALIASKTLSHHRVISVSVS